MERTSVPGVYRRSSRYVFTHRYRGRQHWRSAATLAEARRSKHELEAGVARGEYRELGRLTFGFTLRTYVHLVDGGLGDADFLDVLTNPPAASDGADAPAEADVA